MVIIVILLISIIFFNQERKKLISISSKQLTESEYLKVPSVSYIKENREVREQEYLKRIIELRILQQH